MTTPEFNQTLDSDQIQPALHTKRDLLPLWIKVFIWIFMFFGCLVPVAFVMGIAGMKFLLALYGLQTTAPISLIGVIIMLLFAFKGVVAFGLWNEAIWAVDLAIADAIIGIVICIIVMAILPFVTSNDSITFNIRLELIALIPYLLRMWKIRGPWLGE